jgi:hypothetical protein
MAMHRVVVKAMKKASHMKTMKAMRRGVVKAMYVQTPKQLKEAAMYAKAQKAAAKAAKVKATKKAAMKTAQYWAGLSLIPVNVQHSAWATAYMTKATQYSKASMKKPQYVTNVEKLTKTTCDGEYTLMKFRGLVYWQQESPTTQIATDKKPKSKKQKEIDE